ncbi:hypothetical protein EYF80_046664 [Liparis tanakae]|uniref:Uncharacterized protein n=1 Tax=Liparis tanakae TaxID=230148 RepID=A0A4Z2FRX1_9TELE|nr:hypothetical protein EYF80_046664 [Liparis tanakae]
MRKLLPITGRRHSPEDRALRENNNRAVFIPAASPASLIVAPPTHLARSACDDESRRLVKPSDRERPGGGERQTGG